jgi:hypothetical protein
MPDNAAADSARQLLALHDEGVLPAAEVPDEVHDQIVRRDAEEHFHQVDTARVDASNERNRWRSTVRAIEERLATMPVTLTSRDDEAALRERLKNAQRQLDEAEKALKKAEAVSEAARKAVQ